MGYAVYQYPNFYNKGRLALIMVSVIDLRISSRSMIAQLSQMVAYIYRLPPSKNNNSPLDYIYIEVFNIPFVITITNA